MRNYETVGFIVAGILVMFLALGVYVTVVVPLMDENLYVASEVATPYTDLELRGKLIYQREGCWYCHTQQVRPVKADEGLGPVSQAGDYVYDKPALLGTQRNGPDLMWVGDRLPSEDWHIEHLKDPRQFEPASIMPSYRHLPDHELKALAAYLLSLNSGAATTVTEGDETPDEYAGLENPFEPSDEVMTAGQEVFNNNCAACHGEDGDASPLPSAANFHDPKYDDADTYDEAFFFWRVSEGKLQNGMPAWKTSLSEEERWQVVTYVIHEFVNREE